MQNEMPMMTDRSQLKQEVEFQYCGRSFAETGSSYNSAAHWNIFTKFGTLRGPDLLKTVHNQTGAGRWFAMSTAAILKTLMTSYLRRRWSDSHKIRFAERDADDDCRLKSKLAVGFQYGGRSFSETGSSYNSAVNWDIFTKSVTRRDPDILRTCALPIRNWKLIRAFNGRHLGNFSDVVTTS